ncbi:MAG: polysaccharide biosynthesis/export family protein [Bacteroidales bacterium]|nr:polysaccharide biosynthesis/export family protein [Bacteroidales bacterium]
MKILKKTTNTLQLLKQLKLWHFVALIVLVAFSSCGIVNPTQMLRTERGFKYDKFSDTVFAPEYILSPNDEFTFMVYTLDGERLIEYTQGNQNSQNRAQGSSYVIHRNGTAKLPIVRETKLSGMTEQEAEEYLEGMYSEFLNKPFVKIQVTNKRVIIFPGGDGGNAKVVNLVNNQTSLFEALALAGGINDGRANKIKLIRGDLKNPQVYKIDLSTIDGMKEANLTIQANDIIIVEPRAKIAQKILREITPYLTLVSTMLVIYGLFR